MHKWVFETELLDDVIIFLPSQLLCVTEAYNVKIC